MKIKEVEQMIGMSKKNIRFYEEQGLLSPQRNKENGYREYDEADVERLARIKFLRKLGVPLEEIRMLQDGRSTVSDSMQRHLISLKREQQNLAESIAICSRLQETEGSIDQLDAAALLEEMAVQETRGTSYLNKQEQDIQPVSYVAPVLITLLVVLLMAGLTTVLIWGYLQEPLYAPPLPIVIAIAALFLAIACGCVIALIQRIGEIHRNEAGAARNY